MSCMYFRMVLRGAIESFPSIYIYLPIYLSRSLFRRKRGCTPYVEPSGMQRLGCLGT